MHYKFNLGGGHGGGLPPREGSMIAWWSHCCFLMHTCVHFSHCLFPMIDWVSRDRALFKCSGLNKAPRLFIARVESSLEPDLI